jgi:hypothetical protein
MASESEGTAGAEEGMGFGKFSLSMVAHSELLVGLRKSRRLKKLDSFW